MASPILSGTDPLQAVQWPATSNSNQPSTPGSPKARPTYGTELGIAHTVPIDLSFPLPPKTVWENKFVRFKLALDAKYEVVADNSPKVEQDNDFKFDFLKKKASYTAGIKVQVASSVEASLSYKFKYETIEMVQLLLTNRREFKLALLRNLDAVLGYNLKLTGKDGKPISECLKTIGIGLVFDPDLCFFSVLLPVTFPIGRKDLEPSQAKAKLRFTGNMVLKFAPSRALWIAMARKLGMRRAYLAVADAIKGMTRLLPSEAAKALAEEEAAAARVLAGEALAAEASMFDALVAAIGVYSIALPIALTLTQFMIYTTRAARASGVRDGDLNLYATSYVRTVYGLDLIPQPTSHGIAVQTAAWKQAEQDVQERGRDALQDYLENHFNGGHPVGDVNGVVHGSWEVNPLAERMWLEMRKRFN
ncbi:MAG TPA: hypothetical protein VMH81_28585 [Bryobacteraceae bacterium]|nr:hypothetical protein [Bryobacteraceae bacterium]